MTVIISFILSFIKNKLFEFFKSKYFLVVLTAIIILIYIIFLNINIKSKDKKINDLNNEIVSLEAKNIFLNKDLTFKKDQIYIKQIFTNSSGIIEKQSENKLSSNTIDALEAIIYDYNKAMEIR